MKDPLFQIILRLLKFLTKSFPQMPIGVRVVAYLTFLFVFSSAILVVVFYPIFGVTYFQIRLVPQLPEDYRASMPCDRPEEIWPRCLVTRLSVSRSGSSSVYTNDNGDFTFPVHKINLPFVQVGVDRLFGRIEFDVEKSVLDRDRRRIRAIETVAISTPSSLIGLFSPNPQKIYYVPQSTKNGANGAPQNYFTDADEAVKARPGDDKKITTSFPRDHRGGLFGIPWSPEPAAAIEQSYAEPTFTLRLHRLRLASAEPTNEVYFAVFIDGARAAVKGIPNDRSPAVDQLTVVTDAWMSLEEFDIPVRAGDATVKISAMKTKLFSRIFGETEIGSVTVRPANRFATKLMETGTGLSVEWEIMPPVAIGTLAVRAATPASDLGYWLEMPDQFTDQLKDCQWLTGNSFVTAFGVTFCYGGRFRSTSPEILVKGHVVFRSGSMLRLATVRTTTPTPPTRAAEIYAAIDIYRGNGDGKRALEMVDRATKLPGPPLWTLQARGAILRDLENLRESFDAYRAALNVNPNDISTRVGYGLTLAEWPEARPGDLRDARRSITESLQANQSYSWARVALGALQVRMGEYSAGLETLSAVRTEEAALNRKWNSLIDYCDYFIALGLVGMGNTGEARRALTRFVSGAAEQDPSLAHRRLMKNARSALQKLPAS